MCAHVLPIFWSIFHSYILIQNDLIICARLWAFLVLHMLTSWFCVWKSWCSSGERLRRVLEEPGLISKFWNYVGCLFLIWKNDENLNYVLIQRWNCCIALFLAERKFELCLFEQLISLLLLSETFSRCPFRSHLPIIHTRFCLNLNFMEPRFELLVCFHMLVYTRSGPSCLLLLNWVTGTLFWSSTVLMQRY